MKRENFLLWTWQELRGDAARGQGEYLNAFLQLSGCPNTVKKHFAEVLRSQHSAAFNSQDPWGVGTDVDQMIEKDSRPRFRAAASSAVA